MSKTTVSNHFIEDTARMVEAFENRDLSKEKFIALLIDGKYLAGEQMIIVLGITEDGRKLPLAFVQAATENASAIKPMLEDLLERGVHDKQGLLTIIDGSKGLKKAVSEVFGSYALIQRCIWH